MTISRNNSTGARQRVWDYMRGGAARHISDVARAASASEISVRAYLNALEVRGYVEFEHLGYSGRAQVRTARLIKDTGPRSPSWSVHTDDFRDWNLEPAMGGAELGALIRATGLSIRQWLAVHGVAPTTQTRIRQMVEGQRPVSQRIADLARGVSN